MRFIFLFIFLLLIKSAISQDAEYSQFYANPLYLNPAFTGTSIHPRFALNYRNQWPNLENSFVNYSISYDQYSKHLNGGLGFQFANNMEASGILINTSATIFYSHHIKINNLFFVDAALQAGAIYKSFNKENLVFASEINELNGDISYNESILLENASKIIPDFGVGVMGQYDHYFFGIGVSHLHQPDESLLEGDQKGKLPRKYTIHLGARTKKLRHGLLSKPYTLSPNFIYQQQGSFKQMNLGMYLNIGPLAGGVWYRQNLSIKPDAVIAMLGLMTKTFKLGYSFDFTLSSVGNYSYGSHELSLILFLNKKVNISGRDALLIPSI